MAATPNTRFLLNKVDSKQLQKLSKAIWNWKTCGTCTGDATCGQAECPWSRAERLHTFWNRYKALTAAYVPEYTKGSSPALSSHDDLIRLIQAIQDGPDLDRESIIKSHFSAQNSNGKVCTDATDRDRAVNIAASVMFMINCGTSLDCADILEEGGPSISWRSSLTATEFVSEAFPRESVGFLERSLEDTKFSDFLDSLTASKLVKAGFKLEPTDDLRGHLTMDYSGKRKVIRVFHCSAVLKEMLLASRPDGSRCLIPRLLALEVLDTLYCILFKDDASEALVPKYGLDLDLLQCGVSRYRRKDEPEVDYTYIGTRLKEIYDEIQHPSPRRDWENWFQKYSAQRHMLMATMIGVFIAVVIGILGLGISGFQAYVSYQQWKHPVKDS
ncbi:unnamed protein product [Alternaria alternata]